MAIPGQSPVQGGLGAMANTSAANPAQPNEAKDAARISAMQQDTILSPEEVARKAMVDRKAQSEALEAQLQLLTQSLDARMNPGYNVPLMNLAAGLLKPTRTGSFGESLGYGLENYTKSSQEEMAQKQLIEKQRLEYMQKMADLQNQRSMTDFQMAQLAPRTTLLTGAETPPGAAPAAGTLTAGAPAMPSVAGSSRPMTIDLVKQAYAIDPSGKLGKQFEEQLKMEQEAIKLQRGQLTSTPEGVLNLDTKQYEKIDPYLEKPVNFDFGPLNPPGQNNRPATQDQIQRWNKVNKKDKQAVLDFAVEEGWLAAPSGETDQVDPLGRRSTVLSQDELEKQKLAREAEQARVLENQKLDIIDNAKIRQGIYQAGRDSYGQVLSSDQLYRLATDPKTSGAFGVLQGNDIKSAILGAIAEGVQTPGGSIKFGGIEDAVRKMTGTKEEVNAALQAARYYSELELNFARTYLKGQGAVSDNERKIVGKIGGSLSDTPQVAAAKAETMMARSAYDKQLSDVYYQWEQKNPGKMVKEFERTPEFTKLQSQFNEHMGLLNDKYFPSSAPRPAPLAAPAAAPPAPAAPTNLSPLEKFKAEKARRAAQGN